MNPISGNEPLFEAARLVPGPPFAGAAAEPVSSFPSREAPPRFRHIERNQPAWMVVDLERMLDESHPARSIWDFVGGLDLSRFEESVKVKVGGAGRDSWPPRLLISMWIYAYTRGVSSAREIEIRCQEAVKESHLPCLPRRI